MEEKSKDSRFYQSFGAFSSEKSAEEIVAEIKSSRFDRNWYRINAPTSWISSPDTIEAYYREHPEATAKIVREALGEADYSYGEIKMVWQWMKGE